ncbi:MAG TPA: histidine kinase [Vicinamibacterales bacterium]|nr:histidine kinase [Vicinamibacterales bacterium]
MADLRSLPASTVWLASIGCFTALALLFTSQVWVDYNYAGRPLSWGGALVVALIEWELWALLAPALIRLSERVSFSRERWKVALAVHLPASVAVGAAKLMVEAFIIARAIGPGRGPSSSLKTHLTLLTYWGIVAATHAARHYRQARERELRAAQLETELARAQVEALKMQLHPHFLFNTLNAVSGLMRENVETADQMLSKLAELFQRTFETADVQEVPLRRELEFIDAYLTIQRTRFGERLCVSVAATPEARDTLVPSLILQPLVENAIQHGVAERPGRGRIGIDARVASGRLVITIANDGPPLPPVIREGYGLRNLRSRLEALYGTRAAFSLEPRPDGGATAVVRLPLAYDGTAP